MKDWAEEDCLLFLCLKLSISLSPSALCCERLLWWVQRGSLWWRSGAAIVGRKAWRQMSILSVPRYHFRWFARVTLTLDDAGSDGAVVCAERLWGRRELFL